MNHRLISCLLTVFAAIELRAESALKAFPPAEAGQVRYVINLPAERDERDLRVEIIVGRTVETDARNTYFFGGRIEEVNIPGWGYTRYVVEKIGPLAGTLMAVDPAAPKVRRFIPLRGEPFLVRYNSKLPPVVYVPADSEVRYRIWRAPAKSQPAPRG